MMWLLVEKIVLVEVEVEYYDKESFIIWVKFGVVDGLYVGVKVVIWIIIFWIILFNKVVVYGVDIVYGLYEVIGIFDECWVLVGDKYILVDNFVVDVFKCVCLEEG